MSSESPSSEGELFHVPEDRPRRGPTLSSETGKGVWVSRPVLRLFPTRIEGVQGQVRRAIAVIGYDEASGAQLAGVVERFLIGEWIGTPATWGQLRTAADAELVRDALDIHEIGGVQVVHDSYTDDLLPAYYPQLVRDRSRDSSAAGVPKRRTPAVQTWPCSLCDGVNHGAGSRFCLRHWRVDYEANLATYERTSLKTGEPMDENNTPPTTSRGIPSDPTGDRATARADTGEIEGLIRDELLTLSETKALALRSDEWTLAAIGAEMDGITAGSVAKHVERARAKLTPRRRRLTWQQEIARTVPVRRVKARQPQRSLLGQHGDVSLRGQAEVVCPLCHLIVRRGLMRDGVCATCSETFSDSLSTNGRLVPLSKWQGTTPPSFLAIA